MTNRNNPPKPKWLLEEERIALQPDLLAVAVEVLPFMEGLLPLFERTSMVEAYEEVNHVVTRLRGAIEKEEHERRAES